MRVTKAKQALLETERERDAQAGKYSAAQASLNTHALIAADLKAKVDDAVAHNKLLFISFGGLFFFVCCAEHLHAASGLVSDLQNNRVALYPINVIFCPERRCATVSQQHATLSERHTNGVRQSAHVSPCHTMARGSVQLR